MHISTASILVLALAVSTFGAPVPTMTAYVTPFYEYEIRPSFGQCMAEAAAVSAPQPSASSSATPAKCKPVKAPKLKHPAGTGPTIRLSYGTNISGCTYWRWKCEAQPGDLALSLSTDKRILVDALKMSGAIMQLTLIYRAKVFYKGAVMGNVLVSLLGHAANAPRIVVWAEVMGGVSYANVVWDVLLVLNC
ncbi:hypothetical protein C8R44DRAFT_932278 [Mycena epipterygia]|nr:hypothetical protein C8R44DRAFT_932278 [Mycena epipterygia]